MPESGSQAWQHLGPVETTKKRKNRAQKLPKFEPNSSRRLRAPTGEPLLYSESDEAVRRRRWLDRDDTRRVIESRVRTLRDQRKKGVINPHKMRFECQKAVLKDLKVGQIVAFVPPPHAPARSLWKGEVIALRGSKDVVLDRSPALKCPRKQCNIEVVPRDDCWITK